MPFGRGNAEGAGLRNAGPRRRLGPLPLTTTATIALSGVILLLTACVVYGAVLIVRTADDTALAISVSDDFREAQHALTTQQLHLQEHRLQPASELPTRFWSASARVDAALDRVEEAGVDIDPADLASLRAAKTHYEAAAESLLRAIDDRPDRSGFIAARDAAPAYHAFQLEIDRAATAHYEAAKNKTSVQRVTQRRILAVSGIGFVVALALVLVIWRLMLGYQRDLVRESERNAHDALHDHLTGLPNRILYSDRLAQALAGRRACVATLMVDLDRFKQVNDTLGHHYGDELLLQVGRRIEGVLREGDTVARFGGDEFAVLLPSVGSARHAEEVAERIVAAMQHSFTVADMRIDIECSVGIALAPEHGDGSEELVRRADVAMYQAKEGPESVSMYTMNQERATSGRLALFGELRRAIDNDELILHYQPKIDVAGGAVLGVEALVRWQHPTRGELMPGAFIPLAEETGLIRSLTDRVLDIALAQARTWLDEGYHLPVAVNVSAKYLQHRDLPHTVEQLLTKHGVAPELLALELTESSVIDDPERALGVLLRLHAEDIRLSIDDFGTGFSSLSYLKRLPVDELKVDRSFVAGLGDGPDDRALVRAVIDLGHNLGLAVVAEGVEDERALGFLRRHGCDIAQGFHIARPAPADDLEHWLRGRMQPARTGSGA